MIKNKYYSTITPQWICHHLCHGPNQLVDYIFGTVHYTLTPSTDLHLRGKFIKLTTPRYSVPLWPHQLTALPLLSIINRGSGWMSSCTYVLSACLLVGIQRWPCVSRAQWAPHNKTHTKFVARWTKTPQNASFELHGGWWIEKPSSSGT